MASICTTMQGAGSNMFLLQVYMRNSSARVVGCLTRTGVTHGPDSPGDLTRGQLFCSAVAAHVINTSTH